MVSIQLVATRHDAGRAQSSSGAEQVVCRDPHLVGCTGNAKRLESDLEALLQGKPVRQNVTVKTAVTKWLEFRSKNGITSNKGKQMGDKLVAWCENNDVVLLTAITTERVIDFRTSLPFRTGDSNSLSVHWAVIGGFFSWTVGMGYIEKNPIPNTRLYP